MARDSMRYLKQRGDKWHYVRRVPEHFSHLDNRGTIRVSLKTASLDVAKLRRDAHERADDLFWQGIALDDPTRNAHAAYEAARARAIALGFEYKAAVDLATSAPLEEIIRRVAIAHAAPRDTAAVLGGVDQPKLTVRQAMKLYVEEIAVDEMQGLSEAQRDNYRKVKNISAEMFCAVVGDKPLLDITRADALKFYKHFQERMKTEGISGNTANRRFGNMRKLFREYCRHMQLDLRNPFAELSFTDSKILRKTVLPFEPAYIRDKFLHGDALAGLNTQARQIFLVLIETGCRPSEICNLAPEQIHLKADVPHLSIVFREDRGLKTENSVRDIPLVGVALEVMKLAPAGFHQYRDKETNFSNAVMKFLRSNKLLPSVNHRVYSLRHSYEKRMLEAGYDDEFRRRILGHDTNRPEYGDGGSLAWRRDRMAAIALDYDASLIK